MVLYKNRWSHGAKMTTPCTGKPHFKGENLRSDTPCSNDTHMGDREREREGELLKHEDEKRFVSWKPGDER